MKHISVRSFKEVVEAEQGNSSVDFINVCTPAEYKEQHIEGVRNVPLDEISRHVSEFSNKKTIYVHCRSGNRSQKAIEALQKMQVQAELVNVEGGLMSWTGEGFVTRSLTTRMPIMRQVLLIAGLLVLSSLALSVVNPMYLFLAAFVGAGLSFAGLTGWCGMSFVLARMPWNR